MAQFLMRVLFTMFAEDAGLIPERSFLRLLEEYRGEKMSALPDALGHLWQVVNDGGFSPTLQAKEVMTGGEN